MAERLRIAVISPIADPVAPETGSSIEHLVWLLSEEFVRRGHEVTLFATGDSKTSARLRATYGRGYHHDYGLWSYELHEIMNASAAFEAASGFDIIHSHAYHYALPFTRLTDTPTVHTHHIDPDKDILKLYAARPEAHLTAVSHHHRGKFGGFPDVPVIYNGVDVESFPLGSGSGGYLLFLGHLIEKKGPVEAIEVARRAGMKLVMAGHAGDYYREKVEPLVDGERVEYVGAVGAGERNELLKNAAALVFPINHSEPFGLVMVEAMACGTPVLAAERCAVPEVVEPGVTGHYAPDIASLAELAPETAALDRGRVRREAERRFDHRRMADEYEGLYRRIIGASR